jgi:hypothetical protein
MGELTPLSRVAAAPAPVAPAAPVEPLVAPGEAGEVIEREVFDKVPRTSTSLFTYLLAELVLIAAL